MKTKEQMAQERREEQARRQAQQRGRAVSYIDDDGCGVTVTTEGHVFYNVEDWY